MPPQYRRRVIAGAGPRQRGAGRVSETTVADAYGRPLRNLRISVTAECNYRCIFCHIEGEPIGGPVRVGSLPPRLAPGDYEIIAEAASLLGVESFKITGGEPLVRPDITGVIGALAQGAPGAEISMTTNGYLLAPRVGELADAGLARVNVSIHSLRGDVYEFITGVRGLTRAVEGARAAADAGLGLKVNMVVLKGVNESEIWDLARFAGRLGATLQLIELHPVGLAARFFDRYYYPLARVEEELLARGARVERRSLHNRPVYVLDGLRIEVVRPYANPPFCAGCTRMRIGPFGDVSPCLNWRGKRPNIAQAIRAARGREEKVLAAARVLLQANTLRRPFFLAPLDPRVEWPRRGPPIGRLKLPKRAENRRILEGLERRLTGRGNR